MFIDLLDKAKFGKTFNSRNVEFKQSGGLGKLVYID